MPLKMNVPLYHFLNTTMPGGAKVTRNGEKFHGRVTVYEGLPTVEVDYGGEEYNICCPLCGDKRYRCFVNHRFDTKFRHLDVLGAVHCWNEECQEGGRLGKFLLERYRAWKWNKSPTLEDYSVEDNTPSLSREDVIKRNVEDAALWARDKLAGSNHLSSLIDGHPALEYLKSRGYDWESLTRQYGIKYKPPSRSYSVANRRLAIPITCGGMIVGWQCRMIPGHTIMRTIPNAQPGKWPYQEAKYYCSPGFSKTRYLYNMDQASTYDAVVVVEGITDVWSCGPWSVAMLGRTLSMDQIRLLADWAAPGGKRIVLFADDWTKNPEVEKSWRKNCMNLLTAYPRPDRVRLVMVPGGDPGDLSREESAHLLRKAWQ